MSKVSDQNLRNRLQWVDNARNGILDAIEDKVDPYFKVFPTVDPLKVVLKINLHRPLAKETRQHFRKYLRCWAEKYDCDIPILNINKDHVQAEVTMQGRHWNKDAETGRFKPKPERFQRRSG